MNISLHKLILAAILVLSLPLFSFADAPPCYRDLEVNFFRPEFVNEALSMHSISQSNWSLILIELQNNVKRVPQMVSERAKVMDPNPFSYPFQPQAASELLRQVLFEVFSGTLALFHITNQNNVEEMFQYIRQRQSQRLLSCFGQEMEPVHN